MPDATTEAIDNLKVLLIQLEIPPTERRRILEATLKIGQAIIAEYTDQAKAILADVFKGQS